MSDEASKVARMPEYVLEQWWHRLCRVMLMYFPALIAFGFVNFFSLDSAKYNKFFYSFEKDYAQREGIEVPCSVFESTKSLGCGELKTPEKFMSTWTAIRGMENNKKGEVMKDAYRELRARGYTDYDLAKDIIERNEIQYKVQLNYNYRQLASSFGWSVAIGVVCYLFGLLMYKLILYIVYGHTRIRIKKSVST
jgi:hypothetical protein